MNRKKPGNGVFRWSWWALLVLLIMTWEPLVAQEETASAFRRYKDREVSTGYYENYEVLPQHQRPLIEERQIRRYPFKLSQTASSVRIRTRLTDSHQGIRFYANISCQQCHPDQARDKHTTRVNVTCRQCHGREPISSIEHFYSPMNPIRRHAYVCAKCHEGANASYAGYVIHEPRPYLSTTRKSFPELFYSFWILVLIAVGAFVVFLPHTAIWLIKENLMPGVKKLFHKGVELP